MADIEVAVRNTMTQRRVSDEFRYFMGVTNRMLVERSKAAREILANTEGE